jgi:transmembrane sensor
MKKMKGPGKKKAFFKALMKREQLDESQQELIMNQLAESPDLIRDFEFVLYLIQKIKLAKDGEEVNVARNWDSYTRRIQRYKAKKLFFKSLNAAAIIVLIFSVSLFYIYEGFGFVNVLFNGELVAVRKRQFEDADLLLVCNKDTLPLVKGDDFFAENGIKISYNLSGNGLSLSHLTFRNKNSKIIAITPVGKTANINFSDRSAVYLNASSTLFFPASFETEIREVKLLGEGLFEVNKDLHRKFIVLADGSSKIIVHGTIFNLKAYHDENDIIATLVRGSIGFNLPDGEEQKLKPGEQCMFYKSENKYIIHKVDTSIACSWKDGIIFFKNEKLESLGSRIEHWYGCKVLFETNSLADKKISGAMELNKPLDYLLGNLGKTIKIETNIRDGNIMISERKK